MAMSVHIHAQKVRVWWSRGWESDQREPEGVSDLRGKS